MLFSLSIFCDDTYTLDELNDEDIWSVQFKDNVTYYTRKDNGKVPILCFHKIGEELRYSISAENFEDLLIYLNENNYFLISDKDFIEKDFSLVPSGYTPIVMGSDDASEGNFIYKTVDSSESGALDTSNGEVLLEPDTMVSLLEKHISPSNGRINFTFYVSFNGLPFRQSGGDPGKGEYYRGYSVVGKKFNYLLDNFIIGIHTVTHPITKNTTAEDFKWELDEFYKILYSYVGDRISMIDTLAYPYGCADLKPEMESMIKEYSYNDISIKGAFDFNGYFSHSPFSGKVKKYDISRLGVDNKNINRVYGFLESVPLFKNTRVLVVKHMDDLKGIQYNKQDIIKVVE